MAGVIDKGTFLQIQLTRRSQRNVFLISPQSPSDIVSLMQMFPSKKRVAADLLANLGFSLSLNLPVLIIEGSTRVFIHAAYLSHIVDETLLGSACQFSIVTILRQEFRFQCPNSYEYQKWIQLLTTKFITDHYVMPDHSNLVRSKSPLIDNEIIDSEVIQTPHEILPEDGFQRSFQRSKLVTESAEDLSKDSKPGFATRYGSSVRFTGEDEVAYDLKKEAASKLSKVPFKLSEREMEFARRKEFERMVRMKRSKSHKEAFRSQTPDARFYNERQSFDRKRSNTPDIRTSNSKDDFLLNEIGVAQKSRPISENLGSTKAFMDVVHSGSPKSTKLEDELLPLQSSSYDSDPVENSIPKKTILVDSMTSVSKSPQLKSAIKRHNSLNLESKYIPSVEEKRQSDYSSTLLPSNHNWHSTSRPSNSYSSIEVSMSEASLKQRSATPDSRKSISTFFNSRANSISKDDQNIVNSLFEDDTLARKSSTGSKKFKFPAVARVATVLSKTSKKLFGLQTPEESDTKPIDSQKMKYFDFSRPSPMPTTGGITMKKSKTISGSLGSFFNYFKKVESDLPLPPLESANFKTNNNNNSDDELFRHVKNYDLYSQGHEPESYLKQDLMSTQPLKEVKSDSSRDLADGKIQTKERVDNVKKYGLVFSDDVCLLSSEILGQLRKEKPVIVGIEEYDSDSSIEARGKYISTEC